MSVEHGQFQPCDILSVELVKAVVYVSSYFLNFFCYFVFFGTNGKFNCKKEFQIQATRASQRNPSGSQSNCLDTKEH